MSEPEIVICSAILLPDGRIWRGHRHSDCIRTARETISYRYDNGYELAPFDDYRDGMDQGFITSRNRYVSREDGLELQLAAGVPSACPSGYRAGALFSEDLY